MKRSFLTAVLAFSAATLFANTTHVPNSFLGLSFGPEQRVGIDMGLTMGGVGATKYGLHLGLLGQNKKDDNNTQATDVTKQNEYSAQQAGFYMNVGRAWYSIGAELLQTETQRITRDSYGTPTTYPVVRESKAGAYAKAGYNFGKATIYVGFGGQTQVTVGVGLQF